MLKPVTQILTGFIILNKKHLRDIMVVFGAPFEIKSLRADFRGLAINLIVDCFFFFSSESQSPLIQSVNAVSGQEKRISLQLVGPV
jgi:hypothetical protein